MPRAQACRTDSSQRLVTGSGGEEGCRPGGTEVEMKKNDGLEEMGETWLDWGDWGGGGMLFSCRVREKVSRVEKTFKMTAAGG